MGKFIGNLKYAHLTPLFKNKNPRNKKNYGPVTICLLFLKYLKICKIT